jgi:sugar O-acyltransferase (sialic acid O-acetyltransferase NeuD family)
MKPLLLIGSSGHAAAVLNAIELEGKYRVIGLLDSFEPPGTKKHGYEVCGAPEDAARLAEQFDCRNFLIAVGDNWSRQGLAAKLNVAVPGVEYATIKHPQAIVSRNVILAPGSVVLEGAIIQSNVVAQENCIVNAAAAVGHDCCLGAFASLYGGVRLAGGCRIGDRSAVGLGACVVEKTVVGRDSVISAGAVVFKDVPDQVVVFGNPARIVRERNPDEPYLR